MGREELPYSQYLTDIAGARGKRLGAVPPVDEGSYVVFQALNYPGQNQPVQEAGTGSSPLQVLQRVIKQSVKVTKDISQSSYDGVNTYGSVHNDPLTVLLGLFNGGSSSQGAKLLNQFKFKAYLKSNLENIFVDSAGNIISEDIGTADFKGDVQKIFFLPGMEAGSGCWKQRGTEAMTTRNSLMPCTRQCRWKRKKAPGGNTAVCCGLL